MRLRKIMIALLVSAIFISPALAAWDETRPANNEKLSDTPALIRANWDALMSLTDPDLCITNAKVCSAAAIADSKLATITTANKVSGAAIYLLGSVPAGGGQLPIASGGTGQSTATAAATALLPTQSGNSGKALVTNGTVQSWGFPTSLTISSAATGDILYYNGSAWVRLAAGTSGYYLRATGASAPVWTDVFNTSSGHDHDGSDSKKVLYTNLDMTGITNGHILYNNSGTPAGMELSGYSDYEDGTLVEASADTERSTTTYSHYVKLKEFSPLHRGGTISVTWQAKSNNATWQSFTRLYINGVAVGSEYQQGTSWGTKTETSVSVDEGDVIQIYGRAHSSGYTAYIKEVDILTSNPTVPQEASGY